MPALNRRREITTKPDHAADIFKARRAADPMDRAQQAEAVRAARAVGAGYTSGSLEKLYEQRRHRIGSNLMRFAWEGLAFRVGHELRKRIGCGMHELHALCSIHEQGRNRDRAGGVVRHHAVADFDPVTRGAATSWV